MPWRGQNDEIEPFALQGVLGTNVNLRYRGNELKRNKIWAQKGPVSKGVRVYSYTGFAYPVALATSNWEDSESLNAMSERMNAFISKIGGPEMNHLILTAYNNGSCNIGWHYDKARSLHPETWIAVVKLGPSSRRFALRAARARARIRMRCRSPTALCRGRAHPHEYGGQPGDAARGAGELYQDMGLCGRCLAQRDERDQGPELEKLRPRPSSAARAASKRWPTTPASRTLVSFALS